MVEERLLRAALHVEEHLREPLTVERLAEVACISEYHFHRLFRLWTGEPVIEYVRRLRLEHGAYRLRATRRPVQEIARDVGYESADAFGRAFKDRFGETPRAYRRRWAEASPAGPPVLASAVAIPAESSAHDESNVHMRTMPAWALLCLRKTGPYQEVWVAWQQLDDWVNSHAPILVGAPRVGISHDDPAMVDRDSIRYDACYAVHDVRTAGVEEPVRPPLHWREMPAGDYAVTRHHGAYHELGAAYRRLFLGWLPGSGRYPADAPVVERYLNSPRDVGGESELVTELLLPLL